jgi:hypothetical protein
MNNETLYREIIIDWKKETDIKEDELKQFSNSKFLYCVYCDSHIYGRDVLAYIGKTIHYKVRQEQHGKSFLQFASNVRFVIGFFNDESINLHIPESILIANHKPSYNKEFIHAISSDAKKIKTIVINNGDHGSLKNAVTNFWWMTNNEFTAAANEAEADKS